MRSEPNEGLALYLERAANPPAVTGEREGLITFNLKLVVTIAKRYARDVQQFLDLIQEGNIGLIKAVDSYDPERGAFGSWAGKWIQGQIRNSLHGADCMSEYGRHGKTKSKPVYLTDLPEGFPEPISRQVSPEDNAWLMASSRLLTEKQKAVLAGRLAGYSLSEIATRQGVSHQAVRCAEQNAIRRLSSD